MPSRNMKTKRKSIILEKSPYPRIIDDDVKYQRDLLKISYKVPIIKCGNITKERYDFNTRTPNKTRIDPSWMLEIAIYLTSVGITNVNSTINVEIIPSINYKGGEKCG
ncbi:MAG: hypothetical protein ACTSYF_15270 [Promethearchaeota archaeon]